MTPVEPLNDDLALLRDTPHRERLRRLMDRSAPTGMLRRELIDCVLDIEAAALATRASAGPEHVHTGQWCRPCVLHGSDVTLEGMAEAQRVKAEL